MLRMNRRRGIVFTLALALCTAMTGCLGNGFGFDPSGSNASNIISGPNHMPTGTGYPPPGMLPPATGVDSSGRIIQTSYLAPPRFTGQPMPQGQAMPPGVVPGQPMPPGVVPGQPMPPGAVPGQPMPHPEELFEQPMLGAPSMAMMGMTTPPLPTELARVTAPPHRVAPPDILILESLRLVPRGPYKLEPMEVLQIEVTGAFDNQIKGLYMISPEGSINLGFTLRPIPVAGMTIDQAQAAITEYLKRVVTKQFNVSVSLVQMRGMQNIAGQHLVRPDGTIHLGIYGSVYVAGMTLGQVKCQIENHLAAYLISPQISVDVFAYNSRKIYIVADGAGYGMQVIAIPHTGTETVLDAISRVQGLPQVSSTKKIWVARPGPAGNPCSQILPVDWRAIVMAGRTETNYQLFPGDRIFISSDPLVWLYNMIDKAVAPVERVLGVLFLGSSLANSLRGTSSGGILVAP